MFLPQLYSELLVFRFAGREFLEQFHHKRSKRLHSIAPKIDSVVISIFYFSARLGMVVMALVSNVGNVTSVDAEMRTSSDH